MEIIASDRQAPTSAWQLYRAMVGVGLVCGTLIVGAYLATLNTIAANRAELLQRAIFQVLPGATNYQEIDVGETVYAGFDGNGNLSGLAIPAQGMGYQDVIHILYGYDPSRQQIIGLQVLESKETPGLGDRIEKDPVFLANFAALDVSINSTGDALAQALLLVKPGKKTRPWEIDSISGATISSAAIARMVSESSEKMVPLIYARRNAISWNAEANGGH